MLFLSYFDIFLVSVVNIIISHYNHKLSYIGIHVSMLITFCIITICCEIQGNFDCIIDETYFYWNSLHWFVRYNQYINTLYCYYILRWSRREMSNTKNVIILSYYILRCYYNSRCYMDVHVWYMLWCYFSPQETIMLQFIESF